MSLYTEPEDLDRSGRPVDPPAGTPAPLGHTIFGAWIFAGVAGDARRLKNKQRKEM
jgi:hypothetical protein